jgi:two-component sensor histidine kinase
VSELKYFLRGRIALLCLLVIVLTAAAILAMSFRRRREIVDQLPHGSSFSHNDAWVALGGEWAANSGEIQNNSYERGAKLMTRLSVSDDLQIQVDVKTTSPDGEAGFIIRSSGEEEGVDAYHGYFVGIRSIDSSVEFGRTDFGWLPLLYKVLPNAGGNQDWIHLRVVAVGCTFGVAATFPGGHTSSSIVKDQDCIRSGRFGLRSYLTGATWKNLEVRSAGPEDLGGFDSSAATPVPDGLVLAEPLDRGHLNRYITSLRDEARKHEVVPGVEPISDFPLSPGRHPDVTIQGIVISTPPLAAIQDETGAIIVPHVDPKTPIKLGDFVEAHGTVMSERFRSWMQDGEIRVLWSDTPIPPLRVTASQLTGGTYRGRSIELEAILISVVSQPEGYELVLQDGNQSFRAIGSRDFRLDPADLQPGTRLLLRGIATSLPQFTNNLFPFAVVTESIDVVSAPPWWSPTHVMWLLLSCVLLLICIQLALHQLQSWHLRSVLREREELALEMHDTLAQSFTGIAYQLHAASTEHRGIDRVQAHIQSAIQLVQMSHKEASRTIAALRPQYRDATGILNGLKEAAERLSDGGPLRISTTLSGRSTNLPLEVTDALFRIGQEAVSNAIQHADCTELKMTLRLSRREVQLSIEDDGRGFSGQALENGLGIKGMRSRAAKARAQFDLLTTPGAGTKIVVTAPVPLTRGLFYGVRAMLRALFPGRVPDELQVTASRGRRRHDEKHGHAIRSDHPREDPPPYHR